MSELSLSYDDAVVVIINKLGDLAEAVGLTIPPDDDRQPTLEEVAKILDDLVEAADDRLAGRPY